ncbi:MAG: hypothetical protein PVF56_13820 [Desulfobacterales bacterium]
MSIEHTGKTRRVRINGQVLNLEATREMSRSAVEGAMSAARALAIDVPTQAS